MSQSVPASRVVYVAGWMRSGTTLLCQLLGERPGFVSMGEVSGVLRDYSRGGVCGCGDSIGECEFWGPSLEGISFEEAKELQSRHSRDFRTRYIFRNLRAGGARVSSAPAQTAITALRQSAHSVGVDSSKLVPMIQAYENMGVSLCIVHIIRDPRKVAASELATSEYSRGGDHFMPPGSGVLTSALRWSLMNLIVKTYASWKTIPYQRVFFEDLIFDPSETIESLVSGMQVATESGPGAAHIAVGNPSRNQPVGTTLVETPRAGLTRMQSLAVRLVTYPVRKFLKTPY